MQSALAGISSIGSAANVMVSSSGPGKYSIRFTGTLGGKFQPAVTANGSGLTGGISPSASVKLSNVGGDANIQQTVTDPRGISSKTDVDLLGRTTRTVAGHTSSGSSITSIDQTTDYTYDGDGNALTMTAENPGATPAFQTTQWVYGNVAAVGYGIFSNDLVSKVWLPDPTTGQPSGAFGNFETYGYDDLGEVHKSFHDENGDAWLFQYDVLGRLTQQQLGVVGSGVDGTVHSLVYSYDPNGQLSTASSYSGFNVGTLFNQVKEVYNGLGQLVGEYQSHSGAVTGSTPEVQYGYVTPTGTNADGRLTSITYPNARKVDYQYNTGLDSNISRVSNLADDTSPSSPLEAYQYLGLNTIVQRTRSNNTDLTYIGSTTGPAGDKYVGLDAFGRVVDQNWQVTSTGVSTDRFQYGYDADSNVLSKSNLMSSSNSELYHANGSTNGYDALNRLRAFSRGTLNGTNDSITSPSHTTGWTLDTIGNRAGLSDTTTGTTAEAFNGRNEISSISGKTSLTGSSSALTPVFDKNGNMTKDEIGYQYVYDAWNRLVKIKNSAGTVLETYTYDALGRRITQTVGSTTTDLYYDTKGSVLEERQGSTTTAQYVWGVGYPDALIERDGGGVRMFAQQDANWNVTSLADSSGNVQERYVYDPYGTVTVMDNGFNLKGSGSTAGKLSSSGYNWLYLFQDGRIDTTSMLYHFRARDYSPSLGRWTEPDPAGYIDGANMYQVEGSAPVDMVDPSGLVGEGSHHPYPRYLGGSPNAQPRIWLNKDNHTAAHEVFRKKGLAGPGSCSKAENDAARAKWAAMTEAEQREIIQESLRAANVGDEWIASNIDAIMAEGTPGVVQGSGSITLPAGAMIGALTILLTSSTALGDADLSSQKNRSLDLERTLDRIAKSSCPCRGAILENLLSDIGSSIHPTQVYTGQSHPWWSGVFGPAGYFLLAQDQYTTVDEPDWNAVAQATKAANDALNDCKPKSCPRQ